MRHEDMAGNGGPSFGGAETRRGRRPRSRARERNGRGNGETLAQALGWFSIGLGVAEVVAPRRLARLIGVEDSERNRTILRTMGLREITSGVGLLARPTSSGWMWSRVAGDALDLALIGSALTSETSRRNRALAAAAAVAGVAALDVIGARRVAGSPAERGIHVSDSTTISRPIEEVYRFWRDFENLPRFMKHLEHVRVTGDRRSHWKAKAPAGMSVEWDAEITDDRENELIAWRSAEGSDVSNRGTVRFLRAPGDRGTEVLVEMTYDPPGGKLAALFAKLFREEPSQQVEDDLARFKQVMETGEVLLSDATVRRGPHPARPDEVMVGA